MVRDESQGQRRKSKRVERNIEDRCEKLARPRVDDANNVELWAAIRAGKEDALLAVINRGGIDLNQPARDGSDTKDLSPLSFLVRFSQVNLIQPMKAASLIRILLSHGADPTTRDVWLFNDALKPGRNPVVETCRSAMCEAFTAFVEGGANLSTCRSGGLKTGETCLAACLHGLHGSKPRAKEEFMYITKRLLERSSTSSSAAALSRGIFVNEAYGENGCNTCVSECISFQNEDMLELVLQHGAAPELSSHLWRQYKLEYPSLEFTNDPVILFCSRSSIHKVLKMVRSKRKKVDMITSLLRSGAECDEDAARRNEVKQGRERMVKEDGSSVLSLQALCWAQLMRSAEGDVDRLPKRARDVLDISRHDERFKRFLGNV